MDSRYCRVPTVLYLCTRHYTVYYTAFNRCTQDTRYQIDSILFYCKHLYQEVYCIRKCTVSGSVLYQEMYCTRKCTVPGSVLYQEVYCTGKCTVPGSVLYQEVYCTRKCTVPVGPCKTVHQYRFSLDQSSFYKLQNSMQKLK